MDTHIAPDLTDYRSEPTARLPGEPDLDAITRPTPPADAGEAPAEAPVPVRKPRRRSSLLGGVALAVVFTAGAGAFILSPYNHIIPVSSGFRTQVRQIATKMGVDAEKPFAPAARLAGVSVPDRSEAAEVPAYRPTSREDGLREVLAMRTPPVTPPAPVATPPAPTPNVAPVTGPVDPVAVQEPGSAAPSSSAPAPRRPSPPPVAAPAIPSIPEPGAAPALTAPAERPAPTPALGPPDITDAVTAAAVASSVPAPVPAAQPARRAGAPASAPQASPPPVTASAEPSAAERALADATRLQAAPMSDGQQVQVLEAVTEIATLVKELKTQNTALRADYAKQLRENQARVADLERRVTLAEARAAIRSVSAGAEAPSEVAAPSPAPRAADAPAPALRPIAATATYVEPVSAPVTPKRYRVRAASPGLAMLAEEARGGGDGAQIQVAVGETVPGWGVVKSVVQKGSSWVVNTERGAIE